MIFVGVDISKYKHHCCIINELGEIVQSEFSFENTREGFAVFLSAVEQCGSEETRIGFESTGHYYGTLCPGKPSYTRKNCKHECALF